VSLIRDRLDFLSAEDKEWILRGTAEQFFFAGPPVFAGSNPGCRRLQLK